MPTDMNATATRLSLESIPNFLQPALSRDEWVMVYNVVSTFEMNSSAVDDDAMLNLGSIFYSSGTVNTVENVTDLTPVGRIARGFNSPHSFMKMLLLSMNDFVVPAAISAGILGNLMIVLVFLFTPLKTNALCHYLIAMAVSDFIYLLSCLVVWITGQGINLQNTMGVCQITMFALMLCGFLDTWYLFAAHVERVTVLLGSCRTQKWCTTFRTKCIIITIFVFSLVGFSHYMWVYIVTEWKGTVSCLLMQESSKHIVELGKVEVLIASFLPMLLIIIIDISLFVNALAKCCQLILNSDKNQKKTDSEWRGKYALAKDGPSNSHSNGFQDVNPPRSEFDISKENNRVTVLVVIAGLIFIGLTLPSSIFRAKQYFTLARPSNKDMEIMIFAEEIAKFNSVYKIVLYFIMLKSFRRGLLYFCKHAFWQVSYAESQSQTPV